MKAGQCWTGQNRLWCEVFVIWWTRESSCLGCALQCSARHSWWVLARAQNGIKPRRSHLTAHTLLVDFRQSLVVWILWCWLAVQQCLLWSSALVKHDIHLGFFLPLQVLLWLVDPRPNCHDDVHGSCDVCYLITPFLLNCKMLHCQYYYRIKFCNEDTLPQRLMANFI